MNSINVIPGWEKNVFRVVKWGLKRAIKIFNKKDDAISFARVVSKKNNSILIVHEKDGTISISEDYSNGSI